MPTCVVTGGAGFLGSHLCEYLLERGDRVICIDNLDTGSLENIEHLLPRKDVEFVLGSILSLVAFAVLLIAASYLLGLRHKNGQYILQGLQTDGEYRPKFSDAQAYVSIDLGKGEEPTGKTTLGILTSYASNNYEVEPTSRVTTFGTRQVPLRLFVGFEGQEKMTYNTYQAGVNLAHEFSTGYTSELILSGVSSLEREFRDVEAGYRICEMDNSNNFEECQMVLGVGSEFNHARNALLARIFTIENTPIFNLFNAISRY